MLDDGGSPAPTPISSEIKEGLKQVSYLLQIFTNMEIKGSILRNI